MLKIKGTIIELFLNEAKKICITLLLLDIIIIIVSVIFNFIDYTLFTGILLGNIYTLLNFALLGTIVKNAVNRNAASAKRYMQTHYFVRFLLMAAIFSVGFLSPNVNGWCVVISTLAPKLTYTAIGIYRTIFSKEDKKLGH